MEKTLIIFKPDCLKKRIMGTVLDRFERAGFEIAGCKMAKLEPDLLKEHYAHLADKPIFPGISAFMESGPVVVMILQGDNVIKRVREMVGPTDSVHAPTGTIRGDYGYNAMKNVVHASDSLESAQAEIGRFFNDGDFQK